MARSGAAASLGLGCFLLLWGAAAGGAGPVEGSVPEVAEVELGETARIKCNFSPPGESNYDEINWFYIDRQIPKRVCSRNRGQVFQEDTEYKGRVEMEDFILAISRVTLQDARTFMCQVKAGSSVVAETQTQLHVYKTPEPPEIQVNDAGISVTSNEIPKIAVCVSKNGFPAPNITWYKNSSLLWQDEKQVNILSTLTKESSGLYTVSSTLYANVSREDRQSRYHCQLSYRLLGADRTVASEKVTVTVFYPTEVLRLAVQSLQPEVQEGDEVTLRCEGDGYPPPEYTLLKVKEDRQEEELPSSNGVLTLQKVRKEDSGQYVCRTLDLDSMATLDATAELSVNYLEGIKITPEGPIQLQQGDTLALTCDARGSKPLEFRWKKEKKGKLLGQSRQLKLSNVTHESSGSYSCEVAVEGVPGLARSRQVNVAVHGKPQISAKDSLVPVQQNEVVTLTCKAAAHPEPTITWTVSGTVHNHSDHHRALSNLTVQVTPELLRSGVTCTATNKFGSSNHHIKLQLRTRTTPPPAGNTTEPIKKERKSQESKGVIIVAVIVCILVIAVLGAVLYFLHKKGKIPCGRTGKQDITRPDARKEEIVVEVKSDKLPEEAGLLQGANGEKRPAGDQAEKYIDLRN